VLLFVTSLRHPVNARDYDVVERLLRQTLRSLENQTDDDYRVVVVGHRVPAFALPARTEFVTVDFAPPDPENGVHAGRTAFVRDKGTKLGLGLSVARRWEPDHVMIVDADDLVSSRLTEFVHHAPARDGWVVETGYKYSATRQTYQVLPRFNRHCGSCHVVRFEHYRVPDLDVGASQEDILEAYGERLPRVIGRHRDALEAFAEWGVDLEPLPFRAAVYTVDAGENHSASSLAGLARPVNARFAAEFAVPRARPVLPVALDGLGPRALGQSAALGARRVARAVRTAGRARFGSVTPSP
jgi:hypothetical protein